MIAPLFAGPVTIDSPPAIVRRMSEAERSRRILAPGVVHSAVQFALTERSSESPRGLLTCASPSQVAFLAPHHRVTLGVGSTQCAWVLPAFSVESSDDVAQDASMDLIPDGHWETLRAHLESRSPSPPEAEIDDPDPLF